MGNLVSNYAPYLFKQQAKELQNAAPNRRGHNPENLKLQESVYPNGNPSNTMAFIQSYIETEAPAIQAIIRYLRRRLRLKAQALKPPKR